VVWSAIGGGAVGGSGTHSPTTDKVVGAVRLAVAGFISLTTAKVVGPVRSAVTGAAARSAVAGAARSEKEWRRCQGVPISAQSVGGLKELTAGRLAPPRLGRSGNYCTNVRGAGEQRQERAPRGYRYREMTG